MNWESFTREVLIPSIPPLVGLVASWMFPGYLVQKAVKAARQDYPFDPNWSKDAAAAFEKVIELNTKDEKSPRVLGHLERVLFFVALWLAQPMIIAGWLAFKVATKWDIWKNIVRVPEQDPVLFGNQLDYLYARHVWGLRLQNTFLIGTIANMLAAFFGLGLSWLTCRLL